MAYSLPLALVFLALVAGWGFSRVTAALLDLAHELRALRRPVASMKPPPLPGSAGGQSGPASRLSAAPAVN